MRAATAYFAGVGTVAVAIAGGLGGGLVLGNIMSPQQPKYPSSEVMRLEQRNPQQPIQATNGTQPAPQMAAPQVANTVAEQPAPAPQPQQAPLQQQAQPQPQLQQASTQAAEPPRQPERSSKAEPAAAVQPSPPAEQPAARAAPEDSFARAREADIKREARRAEDKRKAERRQQWADKRKWRENRDDDMRDVEAAVREDTERRSFFGHSERSEPRQLFGREPSFGSGRMTLFDD